MHIYRITAEFKSAWKQEAIVEIPAGYIGHYFDPKWKQLKPGTHTLNLTGTIILVPIQPAVVEANIETATPDGWDLIVSVSCTITNGDNMPAFIENAPTIEAQATQFFTEVVKTLTSDPDMPPRTWYEALRSAQLYKQDIETQLSKACHPWERQRGPVIEAHSSDNYRWWEERRGAKIERLIVEVKPGPRLAAQDLPTMTRAAQRAAEAERQPQDDRRRAEAERLRALDDE
jgi:hypothetical protein